MKTRTLLSFLGIAICIFACLGTCIACNSQKNARSKSIIGELPSNVEFSNSFKAFWDAFATDTKHVKSLEKYTPSDEFAANGAVSQRDGVYIVSGYMTIDNSFDEAAFTALDGEFNKIDETTITFHIPLKRLPEVWKVPGIVSVEAAQKVNLRIR